MLREQGWRSDDSTRLQPMRPGFSLRVAVPSPEEKREGDVPSLPPVFPRGEGTATRRLSGFDSGLGPCVGSRLAPEIFLRVSGFLPPTKPNISKFQFDQDGENQHENQLNLMWLPLLLLQIFPL